MGTDDLPDLSRRLDTFAPGTLLAVGPHADALLATYQDAHPQCRISRLDDRGNLSPEELLAALADHGRFDFVVMRGVLERADAQGGAHLLARLRDVHTRRLCVVLAAGGDGASWQGAELIALGLSYWSSGTLNEATVEVYGFDLGTYKATPDWLNARHWAHPEHWGKFRW